LEVALSKVNNLTAAMAGATVALSGLAFGLSSKRAAEVESLSALTAPQPLSATDGNEPIIVFSYSIQSGDTLWSISERMLGSGARFEELTAINPELLQNELRIGQEILVPYEPEHYSSTTDNSAHKVRTENQRRDVKLLEAGVESRELIKQYEGYSSEAYRCPAGKWTIGYGHTRGVKRGMTISRQEAEELLTKEIEESARYIKNMVTAPLNQQEFDALVSLVYNIGPTQFRSSTLLRELNNENYEEAARQFERWVKSKGVTLRGLQNRRAAEAALFSHRT